MTTPACPAHTEAASGARQPTFLLQDNHSRPIQSLSLSRDGRLLASAGIDGIVRLWDTSTGLMVRRLGVGGMPLAVGLSADGGTLAYYAPDGGLLSIGVVDLGTLAEPRKVGMGNIFMALSPDGGTVAIGTVGVQLYDSKTGAEQKRIDLPNVNALAYDETGKRLAVAIGAELALVDAGSGAILRRWPGPVPPTALPGPPGKPSFTAPLVGQLAFAGETLAVRGILGQVYLVPLKDGAPVTPIRGSFVSVAAARARAVTVDATGQVQVWDAATGGPLGAVPGGMNMGKIAISGDARTIVVAGEVSRNGKPDLHAVRREMRIIDAATLQPLRTIEARNNMVTAVGFGPGGDQLATGSWLGSVARWDLVTGELSESSTGEEMSSTRGVSFDDAGASIATTNGTYFVRVRDAKSGKVTRQWNAHESTQVTFAQFLPGTTELVTAGTDGTVRRWDLSGTPQPAPERANRFTEFGKPAGKLVGKTDFKIQRAVLSPDGWRIAAAGPLGEIALLGLQDGSVRWETHLKTTDPINFFWIAFTADGSKVLASGLELKPNDKGMQLNVPTLRVLGAQSGQVEQELLPGTAGPMLARGATVAIGGAHPAFLGPTLGDVRRVVGIPDQQIMAVALHPKRPVFAFSGDGGGTTLVDADSGKPLVFFIATASGEFVTATPEGAFRASLDGARSVAWAFDAPLEAFSFEQFAAKLERPDLVMARLAGSAAPFPEVGRPPSIQVDRAAFRRTVTGKSAKVDASVSAGFVEDLRVFVNGRPVVDKPICAPQGRVELDVPLVGGRNRVSLVAYDSAGFASNALALDVSAGGGSTRPELWALTVGVSRYPKLPRGLQLEVANADARSVSQSLAAQVGPGKPYSALHATTLTDEKATGPGITAALAELSAMKPDDLAVVFFAGHGVKLGDGKMVFLTSGATLSKQGAQENGIGWSTIEAALAKARGHVLVLLDACHSGHVSTDVVAPNEDLARELAAGGRGGVLVFAAARGSQLSYECRPEEEAHRAGSSSRGRASPRRCRATYRRAMASSRAPCSTGSRARRRIATRAARSSPESSSTS